jgi:hypothetical protein
MQPKPCKYRTALLRLLVSSYETMHETTVEDYKDFEGIKVATRSRIRRGDKRYIEIEGIEFNALADVKPEKFVGPK